MGTLGSEKEEKEQEKKERTRETERDTPRTRSQAATNHPDMRSSESELYRMKER